MKEIVDLECGFKAYKNTIPKQFSYICTPDLVFHIDRGKWDKDLYDHYISGFKRHSTEGTYFPTKNEGKIYMCLNSLEELYEVARFFNKNNFRTSYGECSGRFDKLLISRDKKDFKFGSNIFELYVHIKSKDEYYRFRELLISEELKDLGYFVIQEAGEYPGLYMKTESASIRILT